MNKSPRIVFPPYRAFFMTSLLLAPVHFLIPMMRILVFPYTIAAGGILILLAIFLCLQEQQAMHRHRQSGLYAAVPSTLITDGPFRVSRNPLYLGMVLFPLGIALLLGSLSALVLVALEWIVINFLGIPFEEKVLEDQFGDSYVAYKRRVRRWL